MFIRNLPSGGGGSGVTPGGGSSGFTPGAVIIANAAGALDEDPTVFFWDATNNRLGIGTNAPASLLHVAGTVAPAANANGYLTQFNGTLTEAGSGTHAVLANVAVLTPTVTGGAATVNGAASLYIEGAPTGTFALYTATIAAAPDTDALAILGRTAIGSWNATDEVNIGHYDFRATTTGYAFRTVAAGTATILNTPNSGTLYFVQGGNLGLGWNIPSTLHWVPLATNAQDVGTTSARVRDQFMSRTFNLTQTVITSGTPNPMLNIVGGANTGLTASAEANDVYFNLNRTVQFATGALTTQRAVRIGAPTYAFVGASTISDAATVYIEGAPAAGTNATITRAYSLWIDAGLPRIDSTTANGSVATVLGSVGPTGSNTTVQEWLTININGNTRYIPCF